MKKNTKELDSFLQTMKAHLLRDGVPHQAKEFEEELLHVERLKKIIDSLLKGGKTT